MLGLSAGNFSEALDGFVSMVGGLSSSGSGVDMKAFLSQREDGPGSAGIGKV